MFKSLQNFTWRKASDEANSGEKLIYHWKPNLSTENLEKIIMLLLEEISMSFKHINAIMDTQNELIEIVH